LPLALKFWLGKMLVQYLADSFVTVEKNILLTKLAGIETDLLEEQLEKDYSASLRKNGKNDEIEEYGNDDDDNEDEDDEYNEDDNEYDDDDDNDDDDNNNDNDDDDYDDDN
jgi:hypothetical protein